MVQFLIKRFIGLIFVVIGVTFITFTMGYFAPGDPIRTMMGSHFDPVDKYGNRAGDVFAAGLRLCGIFPGHYRMD